MRSTSATVGRIRAFSNLESLAVDIPALRATVAAVMPLSARRERRAAARSLLSSLGIVVDTAPVIGVGNGGAERSVAVFHILGGQAFVDALGAQELTGLGVVHPEHRLLVEKPEVVVRKVWGGVLGEVENTDLLAVPDVS